MYRLSWPCAAFFAGLGLSLLIKVEIIHDDETNIYLATSHDLNGLVMGAKLWTNWKKKSAI